MSQTLLSFLEGQLSSDVIARLSTFIGEPALQTGTAALAVQQALLVAMTQKAASTHGVGDLLGMIDRAEGTRQGGVPTALDLGASAHSGATLSATLLGDSQPAVIDWLAAAAGIGHQGAASLLAVLSPLVLAGIGRYLGSFGGGVNASALSNVLGNQSAPLLANIPLGLAGALSLPSVAELTRGSKPAPHPVADTTDTGLEFLKWVLPLLALTAMLIYVTSSPAPVRETARPDTTPVASTSPVAETTSTTDGNTAAPAPEAAPDPARDPGPLVERPLPRRQPIRVPASGIESQLLAFITDTTRAVDSTTWFTFDRLEFDTGSATLRPASDAQLDAMAAILQAYPRVTLKIGGYTDNVGDEAANLRLSSERAEATRQALISRGIAARRLDAEGFGNRFAVATNTTEAGRQRNRRIDVRVTRK